MRIALLVFSGAPTEVYYLTCLGQALSQAGSEVTVFIPDGAKGIRLDSGLNVVSLPCPLSRPRAALKYLSLSFYQHLLREIDAAKADLVHIGFEIRAPFFAGLALRHKHPVVVTVHEPRPLPLPHRLIRSVLLNHLHTTNTGLLIKTSDKVIVHGEAHKRYLVAKGAPERKVEVIPHGDFSFFTKLRREEVQEVAGNILFFGRLLPYKGIEYLIQAGKIVKSRFPGVTVTIAGKGNSAKYRRLIGGDSYFTVHDRFIPDQEVAELFQRASIVVLPYVDGSQSGIISIAYSFKKAVVATSVGNLPEMVLHGETGLVVPPADFEALSRALIRLLEDGKLRQAMGDNGYEALKGRFSWTNVARKTLAVYESAIELRRPSLSPMGIRGVQ